MTITKGEGEIITAGLFVMSAVSGLYGYYPPSSLLLILTIINYWYNGQKE